MHGNRISCETNAGTRIKIDIGFIYSISRNTAAVCVYKSLCFTKIISIIDVTTLVCIFVLHNLCSELTMTAIFYNMYGLFISHRTTVMRQINVTLYDSANCLPRTLHFGKRIKFKVKV